jgi:hypothetical protein
MVKKKTEQLFKLGDRVKILHSSWQGRIVELRGPLGPGGVQVYRVRVPLKPKPHYPEVLGDQLELIPPKDVREADGAVTEITGNHLGNDS